MTEQTASLMAQYLRNNTKTDPLTIRIYWRHYEQIEQIQRTLGITRAQVIDALFEYALNRKHLFIVDLFPSVTDVVQTKPNQSHKSVSNTGGQ